MPYMTPQERQRALLGYNVDPEDRRFNGAAPLDAGAPASVGTSGPSAAQVAGYGLNGGAMPSGGAMPGGAAAGAAGAGSAMPWIGVVSEALARRQQEQDAKRQARADLAAQYASTQGDFPMYGVQAVKRKRAIDNQMGGPGLGTLRRLGKGLGSRFGG